MLALTLSPDGHLLLTVPASSKSQTISVATSRKTRLSITADRSVVIHRMQPKDSADDRRQRGVLPEGSR